MEKKRKIPQRKCVGCGERRDKGELCRIVKMPDGGVCLDKTGRMAGRGAYLCRDVKCLRAARRAHRLETSLETAIPDAVYTGLEEALADDV